MAEGILGKKLGMTQVFTEEGKAEAVTAVEAGPCTVLQIKTSKKEGYEAVQYGFGEAKNINSPRKGQMKELGNFRYLKELRVEDTAEINIGDKVDASLFQEGDLVDITGISKGKGFAGVIKRWGFHRGPKTHGSKHHRAPGSTGMSAYPGKVHKGKKMPGHMGTDRMTFKNIEIIDKKSQENLLLVKGDIPGAKNGIITISKS